MNSTKGKDDNLLTFAGGIREESFPKSDKIILFMSRNIKEKIHKSLPPKN